MSIGVHGISKSFGRVRALQDVDLRVERGSLAALLGPSGCGKSTLLRLIAGFETPDAGRIVLDDRDVTRLSLGRRDVGFVFQNYALFPHQTVAQNVGFALAVRGREAAGVEARVAELLDLVQLTGYERRRPHELSGGQRQRVALARALAASPSYLLLDEPFAALDSHVRKDLRRWLRDLHERTHVTTILVTHDAEEAMEIADRIVVMREGVVQQAGSPRDVYAEPANPFVMRFFGEVNALRSSAATIYVRPADFRIEDRPFGEASAACVRRVSELGPRTALDLALTDGQAVNVEIDPARAARLSPAPGMTVYLEPTRFRSFAAQAPAGIL
jgi:sulfate transport system ATP-binding protein